MGCVFSLALVWSVLGPDKLKIYERSLEDAIARIPNTSNSAYGGSFHDGEMMLEEVNSMHNEVVRASGGSDYIITELVPIITDMLKADPRERPSAMTTRKRWHKVLNRARKLSASEGKDFPLAFRTEAEAAMRPQPLQDVWYTAGRCLDTDGSYVSGSVDGATEEETVSRRHSRAVDGADVWKARRRVETWHNQTLDGDQPPSAEPILTLKSITVSLWSRIAKPLPRLRV
jgi:hypothetical protein